MAGREADAQVCSQRVCVGFPCPCEETGKYECKPAGHDFKIISSRISGMILLHPKPLFSSDCSFLGSRWLPCFPGMPVFLALFWALRKVSCFGSSGLGPLPFLSLCPLASDRALLGFPFFLLQGKAAPFHRQAQKLGKEGREGRVTVSTGGGRLGTALEPFWFGDSQDPVKPLPMSRTLAGI